MLESRRVKDSAAELAAEAQPALDAICKLSGPE